MTTRPLVSIVVIFLNAEPFLAEALDSVLDQTYDTWELLLVDDGSTDASTGVAHAYAMAHPERVRYLEHPGHANRGMSASRNLGIRHAQGEYVAFLDADDVWLPGKLADQVAVLDAHPDAGMVYGPTQWWYSWTGRHEDRARDFVHHLGVPADTLVRPPRLLELLLRDEGASPCTCSMLVRRAVIEQIGGFEENFRGLYEDQAFCAKLSLVTPIFVSGHCWYRYRQHENSACSVAQRLGHGAAARRRFLEWLDTYLVQVAAQDEHVWHALRVELRRSRQQAVRQKLRHALGGGYRAARYRIARLPSLPLIRHVRCVQFRRLRPLENGRQRGTPIVRSYWADFLRRHAPDIRGRALEIGSTDTLEQYGGAAVTRADALDLTAHSPQVNVVADLSRADHVPSDTYDCFVNQFTMSAIYDVEAALYHSLRVLKPCGTLLVNFSCVEYYFPRGLDMQTGGTQFMFWWFTPIQVENLLRRTGLSGADYEVTVYGNLFARVAYQMNVPAEELTDRELRHVDPGHPLLICVRAVKPPHWQASRPVYRDAWFPEVQPARWNPVTGHYG